MHKFDSCSCSLSFLDRSRLKVLRLARQLTTRVCGRQSYSAPPHSNTVWNARKKGIFPWVIFLLVWKNGRFSVIGFLLSLVHITSPYCTNYGDIGTLHKSLVRLFYVFRGGWSMDQVFYRVLHNASTMKN